MSLNRQQRRMAERYICPVGYLREQIEAALFELDADARPDLGQWYAAFRAGEFVVAGAVWNDDQALAPGCLTLLCTVGRPPRQPLSFWLALPPGPELSTIAETGLVGIGPRGESPYLFSVATDPPRRFLKESYRERVAS